MSNSPFFRCVLFSVFLSLLLALPFRYQAIASTGDLNTADPSTNQQSYAHAVALTTACSELTNAIDLLKRDISANPNNSDYHVALACAYTSRAAVVYRALIFHSYLVTQSNSSKTVIDFKDDGTPYDLTDEQAVSNIMALYEQSTAEFSNALSNARPPSATATVHFAHAWSDRIFSKIRSNAFSSGIVQPQISGALAQIPAQRDASISEIALAVKRDPDNAQYWQAAGDIEDVVTDNDLSRMPSLQTPLLPDVQICYHKSLTLMPKNEFLWLKLASMETGGDVMSRADVEEAIAANPNNAYTLLLDACYILRPTDFVKNSANIKNGADPGAVNKAMVSSLTAADIDASKRVERLVTAASASGAYQRAHYSPAVFPMLITAEQYVKFQRNQDDFFYQQLPATAESIKDITGIAITLAIQGDVGSADALMLGLDTAIKPMRSDSHFVSNGSLLYLYYEGSNGLNLERTILNQRKSICDTYGTQGQSSAVSDALNTFDAHSSDQQRAAQSGMNGFLQFY